jgi:ketosteroid isomerase-like protein
MPRTLTLAAGVAVTLLGGRTPQRHGAAQPVQPVQPVQPAQPVQPRTAADTIRALDSAWARAYARNDTALALQLFADDLVVTSGAGVVKDRAGEMRDVRATPGGTIHYFRTSDVRVRVHGGAAVAAGLAAWSYTWQGRRDDYRRRYTATFARGGPLGWRMVALHIGPAPEPR